MSILKKNVRLSVEEYLKGEEYSDLRHEYEHGEVVAMVEASRKHNRLARNVFACYTAIWDRRGVRPSSRI